MLGANGGFMEKLDIYDDNGYLTGKTIIRGDKSVKLSSNDHIALVVIFIENSKHEFLIQKTSKEKDNVFATTGGHVISGETPYQAIIREVSEELGIDISNDDIEDLGYLLYDMPLRYVYYLKKDIDIKKLNLQKEEVEYVKYMSIEKINDLIKSNAMLLSHAIQFKHMLENRDNKKKGYFYV